MSQVADRFKRVAEQFTSRANAVTEEGWDNPSPCEGWVARDIVRHMAAWMPVYFLGAEKAATLQIPSADRDPVRAWEVVRDAIQAALDEGVDRAPEDFPTLEQAVAAYGIGDVLIHTWDLARATGLDETLDGDEVRRALRALSGATAGVLENGHFGARIDVPDDADEQTKLLALTGRRT